MKQIQKAPISYLKNPKVLFLVCLSLISLSVYRLDQLFTLPRGLEGKYYANLNWQGSPRLVILDFEISTALLKDRRRKFPENRFSIEWNGFVIINKTGEYTFATASDDGSWLYIDDRQVVDNGGSHGLKQVSDQIYLQAGVYPIRVRYFQAGGYARMDLSWAQGRQPLEKLPSYILSPTAISYRDYKLRCGLDYFLIFLKFVWLGALAYFVGLRIVDCGLRIFYSVIRNPRSAIRDPQSP